MQLVYKSYEAARTYTSYNFARRNHTNICREEDIIYCRTRYRSQSGMHCGLWLSGSELLVHVVVFYRAARVSALDEIRCSRGA